MERCKKKSKEKEIQYKKFGKNFIFSKNFNVKNWEKFQICYMKNGL